jgi:hypothetical protein
MLLLPIIARMCLPRDSGCLTISYGLEPRFRVRAFLWRLRATKTLFRSADQARTSNTEVVQGTRNALATWLQDVGVNHGRSEIVVPEPLLNGANVSTALEQVRGEGMAKGMGADGLRQTGTANGHRDGVVDEAEVNILVAGDTGTRVDGDVPGGQTYCQPHALAACGDVRASAWGR